MRWEHLAKKKQRDKKLDRNIKIHRIVKNYVLV